MSFARSGRTLEERGYDPEQDEYRTQKGEEGEIGFRVGHFIADSPVWDRLLNGGAVWGRSWVFDCFERFFN